MASPKQARRARASRSSVDQSAAGAGTTWVGSQSGSAQTQAGGEAAGDIQQTEAYTVQLKRLIAGELDLDSVLRTNAGALVTRATRNGEDWDGQLRNVSLQALQNAVQLAQRVAQNATTHDSNLNAQTIAERERTTRAGDLAIDRQWNLNETDLAATTAAAVTAAVLASLGKAAQRDE